LPGGRQPGDGGAEAAEGVAAVVKVVTALRREFRGPLRGVKDSPLASSALALAALVDDPETRATGRTQAARELRETLAVLREQASVAGEDRMTKYELHLAGREEQTG
jgi:hypothetical protein